MQLPITSFPLFRDFAKISHIIYSYVKQGILKTCDLGLSLDPFSLFVYVE
jgi:hypothetical protein